MTPQSAAHSRRAAGGFSLLELVISIALVLVLMLAITKIFSITSTTIGASQGIAAATRDARAAQATFSHDIGAMASDSPFIWIRYDDPVPAFRNAADMLSDRDYTPGTQLASGASNAAQNLAKRTLDFDDNGTEGETTVQGELIPTLTINNRNHRLDRFSFCARDKFVRQTGNTNLVANTSDDVLVNGMTSPEAWITYGHLVLPQNTGDFNLRQQNGTAGTAKNLPGDGTEISNPQNFYASQWVLGRVAPLMVLPTNAPSATPATEYINDVNGISQEYFGRNASWTGADDNMTPLSDTTVGHDTFTSVSIRSARYDLVGTDIYNATDRINRHITAEKANPTTYMPWFANMLGGRFEVNPFVVKPISAANASQQVPVFLPGCSQFIVEYAGDFVTQRADGSLNTTASLGGLTSDGEVDFHYNAATGQRQIQWFGYPRSTTGNNVVSMANGDVGLVCDFVHYISGAGQVPAITSPYTNYAQINTVNADFGLWERFGAAGTGGINGALTRRNTRPLVDTYIDTPSTPGLIGTVFAAWGPDSIKSSSQPRPKMFRITVTIDRPEIAGRSADGQTFEYIFNAP